ncbi:hypothetical protein AURDEDRAFT_170736 [Auricularia subglabra TFB-10046 SS5]|uniref:Uncharacterized protein n=1 Tax=Auricularia subglabra (strain TFB-10046 / SS5) TaxID=717982 RepID=J0DCJ0_AURST|nr:hypothetical protein AURDEDRAFT_170736 [Auricularia subglabra TFB-10046 SS5]
MFPPSAAIQLGGAVSEFTSCAVMDGPPMSVRFVSRPPDQHHLMRAPGVLSHLTSLVIHEFLWFTSWDVGGHAPLEPAEAPSLRHLRILLAPPDEHQISFSFRKSGLSCFSRPLPWRLPSLSTLHFSFRPTAAHRVLFVALSEAHAFVASCVATARLAALELTGVEVVDVDAHLWLARLHDVVESTSVSTQPATSCVADARPYQMFGDPEDVFRDDLGL